MPVLSALRDIEPIAIFLDYKNDILQSVLPRAIITLNLTTLKLHIVAFRLKYLKWKKWWILSDEKKRKDKI
jgi:hypothetical protein